MLYHIARGSVDYTIVGSPTIVDNVLTDITANDYLSIGTYSGDTPTSIEIGASFKTSDTTVFGNSVIGRLTGADTGIFWGNSSFPGRICFKHRVSYNNGTTWTAVESKSAVLSLNTRYYVKFIISLAEQKLTGYVSTDNTNWTSYVANFNSGAILEGLTSIAIGKIFGHNASPLPIYLDYTYIKVNGKPWFGICPIEVKKHQIMGPVGYTVVGSPTITDGVMSDISNANYAYATTDSTMYQSIVSFETAIKFTTGASAPTGNLFGWQNGHGGAYLNNSSRIRCVAIDFSAKKYRDYLTSFSALQANKTYYFKYEFKNNQGYCSLKEEGGEWQTEEIETGVNNFNQPSNYNYFYGRNNQASGYLTGGASIDFNNTYIKVNGKLWFWQPQETKRIVVNGVEVWTKPE